MANATRLATKQPSTRFRRDSGRPYRSILVLRFVGPQAQEVWRLLHQVVALWLSRGREYSLSTRLLRVVVVMCLMGTVLSVAPGGRNEAEAASRCFGKRVTIQARPGVVTKGTSGPDVIRGTNGPDIIRGRGGNDLICSRGGDDNVTGNGGNDKINAGSGVDKVKGGGGNDKIWGKSGADTLNGGKGSDTIKGGAGADVLLGKGGADVLKGGGGNDTCTGGGGANTLTSCNEASSPVPSATCTNPADMGEARRIVGSSTDITVVVDCYVDRAPAASRFYEALANTRLVALRVRLTNNGSEAWFGCASTRIVLRDSVGANYRMSATDTSLGQDFGCPTVRTGESVTGFVTAEIPTASRTSFMRWDECCSSNGLARLGDWSISGAVPSPIEATGCSRTNDMGAMRQVVGFESQVTLRVECFTDPAAARSRFYEAPDGERLVAAKVTLINTGDEEWFGCASTRLTLRATSGESFSMSATDTGLGADFACPIVLPGEAVTGWATAELPNNRTPAFLRWEECCSSQGDARLADWVI